jgi:NAD(P)-dependent dehydrogenase (short-subunit alcohol dehydrogenase family)
VIVAAPIDEADPGQAVESLQAGGVETVGLAADIADDRAAGSLIELHLDRTLAVNVRGTSVMSREAARVMEPVGAIVNTASTATSPVRSTRSPTTRRRGRWRR